MENLLRRIVPVAVIAAIVAWGATSISGTPPADEKGPDLVRIRTLQEVKTLEMPPAVFLHDQHTQALGTSAREDCALCHEPLKKARKAGAPGAMEEAFHATCFGCHESRADKNLSTGPLEGECRLCHLSPQPRAKRVKLGMDRSLHFRHVASASITYTGDQPNPDGQNCGVCHHVYNEEKQQLVWEKGAEQACSACHGKRGGSLPSLRKAMHGSCLSCHVETASRLALEKTMGDAGGTSADGKDATPDLLPKDSPSAQQPGLRGDELPKWHPVVPPKLQRIAWNPDKDGALLLAATRLAPGQIAIPGADGGVIPSTPESTESAGQTESTEQPKSAGETARPAPLDPAPAADRAPDSAAADPSSPVAGENAPAPNENAPAGSAETATLPSAKAGEATTEPQAGQEKGEAETAILPSPKSETGEAAAEPEASPSDLHALREQAAVLFQEKRREDVNAEMEREAQAIRQAADLAKGNGPITCAGCHGKAERAAVGTVNQPPRLLRGQPDATVLVPTPPLNVQGKNRRSLTAAPDAGAMAPVLFNHKTHEAASENCRVCHHKKISACTDCHTLDGAEAGRFVPLSQAMHKSCVGCHQKRINSLPQCAGCHASVGNPMEIEGICTRCHQPVGGLSTAQVADGSAFALGSEQRARIAEANLMARELYVLESFLANPPAGDTAAPKTEQAPGTSEQQVAPLVGEAANLSALAEKMPETVRIGALSNEFEPSVFPHRKIFLRLSQGMTGIALADVFHGAALNTCAACHHHSPKADLAAPPACANCHGLEADKRPVKSNRPSLKAAYHQQCLACHERMGIAPAANECAACHQPKKPVADAR